MFRFTNIDLNIVSIFSETTSNKTVIINHKVAELFPLQLSYKRVDQDMVGRVQAAELVHQQVQVPAIVGIGQERRQVAWPEPG